MYEWTDSKTVEVVVAGGRKNWLPLILLALAGAAGAVVMVSEHDQRGEAY